jgi:hypothetical protein
MGTHLEGIVEKYATSYEYDVAYHEQLDKVYLGINGYGDGTCLVEHA